MKLLWIKFMCLFKTPKEQVDYLLRQNFKISKIPKQVTCECCHKILTKGNKRKIGDKIGIAKHADGTLTYHCIECHNYIINQRENARKKFCVCYNYNIKPTTERCNNCPEKKKCEEILMEAEKSAKVNIHNISEQLSKAFAIAVKAHYNQYDKANKEYICHPITVAFMCTSRESRIVALLHDVIEDSFYTIETLKKCGFSENVLTAVKLLTRSKDVSYNDYLKEISKNRIASEVKLADMLHNSDITRFKNPTQKELDMCNKYKKRIDILIDMIEQKKQ